MTRTPSSIYVAFFVLIYPSSATYPSGAALQASEDEAALAATAAARSPLPGLNFGPLRGALEELRLAVPFVPATSIMSAYKATVESFMMDELKESLTELLCMRDYSVPCPERWADLGDGVNCLAPEGFAVDGCRGKEALVTKSVAGKRLFAKTCNVAWPCQDACAMNFDLMCPDGWILNELGYCLAPYSYSGPCLTAYYLSGHNAKMKRAWSEIC